MENREPADVSIQRNNRTAVRLRKRVAVWRSSQFSAQRGYLNFNLLFYVVPKLGWFAIRFRKIHREQPTIAPSQLTTRKTVTPCKQLVHLQ
jgi:hypothetical protein